MHACFSRQQLTCVMRKKEDQVLICLILHLHLDRGTESSEQGGHRLTGHICEDELLFLFTHPQNSCGITRLVILSLQPLAFAFRRHSLDHLLCCAVLCDVVLCCGFSEQPLASCVHLQAVQCSALLPAFRSVCKREKSIARLSTSTSLIASQQDLSMGA